LYNYERVLVQRVEESWARLSARAKVALAVGVAVIVASPWLVLIPGHIWPLFVIEQCDAEATEQYGKESVSAIRGAEHVRWWPPAWVCPLTNGEVEDLGE